MFNSFPCLVKIKNVWFYHDGVMMEERQTSASGSVSASVKIDTEK